MRVYRSRLGWKLTSIAVVVVVWVGAFLLWKAHPIQSSVCFLIGLFVLCSEHVTLVVIDDRGIKSRNVLTVFAGLLSLSRWWGEWMSWSEISQIYLSWNPFFIESNLLVFIPQQHTKRTGRLTVPIYQLQGHSELLQEILAHVPAGVSIDPQVHILNQTKHLTPLWQKWALAGLLCALVFLFVIGIVTR